MAEDKKPKASTQKEQRGGVYYHLASTPCHIHTSFLSHVYVSFIVYIWRFLERSHNVIFWQSHLAAMAFDRVRVLRFRAKQQKDWNWKGRQGDFYGRCFRRLRQSATVSISWFHSRWGTFDLSAGNIMADHRNSFCFTIAGRQARGDGTMTRVDSSVGHGTLTGSRVLPVMMIDREKEKSVLQDETWNIQSHKWNISLEGVRNLKSVPNSHWMLKILNLLWRGANS